jgi:hypothetical protein
MNSKEWKESWDALSSIESGGQADSKIVIRKALHQRHGVYTETIRRGLQAIIQLNQSAWIGVFEKEKNPV